MTVTAREAALIRLHTHPDTGSRFWLAHLAGCGWTWEQAVENPADVPPVTVEEMRPYGIEAFLPGPLLENRPYLVTSETSGFSGQPVLTCFTENEFRAGFVTPFVEQAERVGFPLRTTWLWAGPSGPHIVGKALREILRTVGGTDPFAVDFDPRWFRRQARDSLSARRYFSHILSQIDDIVQRQNVEVLYATPPVVKALADKWPEDWRLRIRGVHYAGMAMSNEEYGRCQSAFPNAVHMSGYGNSLFGMFPETVFSLEHGITYAVSSDRVQLRVVREPERCRDGENGFRDCEIGEEGRIVISRFDESVLILNMVLEDLAVRTADGIRNPHRPHHQFEGKLLY